MVRTTNSPICSKQICLSPLGTSKTCEKQTMGMSHLDSHHSKQKRKRMLVIPFYYMHIRGRSGEVQEMCRTDNGVRYNKIGIQVIRDTCVGVHIIQHYCQFSHGRLWIYVVHCCLFCPQLPAACKPKTHNVRSQCKTGKLIVLCGWRMGGWGWGG